MRGGDAVERLLVALLFPADRQILLLFAFEIGGSQGGTHEASAGKIVPHQELRLLQIWLAAPGCSNQQFRAHFHGPSRDPNEWRMGSFHPDGRETGARKNLPRSTRKSAGRRGCGIAAQAIKNPARRPGFF